MPFPSSLIVIATVLALLSTMTMINAANTTSTQLPSTTSSTPIASTSTSVVVTTSTAAPTTSTASPDVVDTSHYFQLVYLKSEQGEWPNKPFVQEKLTAFLQSEKIPDADKVSFKILLNYSNSVRYELDMELLVHDAQYKDTLDQAEAALVGENATVAAQAFGASEFIVKVFPSTTSTPPTTSTAAPDVIDASHYFQLVYLNRAKGDWPTKPFVQEKLTAFLQSENIPDADKVSFKVLNNYSTGGATVDLVQDEPLRYELDIELLVHDAQYKDALDRAEAALVGANSTVAAQAFGASEFVVKEFGKTTTAAPPAPDNKHIGAAVGGAIGGVILLLVIVYFVRKNRNSGTGSSANDRTDLLSGNDNTNYRTAEV